VRVRDRLHAVEVVFTNLECCLYEPDGERSPEEEGFYTPLKAAETLTIAGVRFGFLQRTSVYWSHGHGATATYPGVATLKAHTAYRPQIEQLRTLTHPGMSPEVITWADPAALAQFREDMAVLRSQADVVIASHHWGLDHAVLDYQVELAHTAIEAGADLVMGHGPHMPLGIELYKGKPIFYGVGNCSRRLGSSA
jgi:Bacterial capsule synthesis protein PGA_cap